MCDVYTSCQYWNKIFGRRPSVFIQPPKSYFLQLQNPFENDRVRMGVVSTRFNALTIALQSNSLVIKPRLAWLKKLEKSTEEQTKNH